MTLFKNLARSAERELSELGMDQDEAAELLIPVYELLEHLPFWQGTHEGLAVFRSPDMFRAYRVSQPRRCRMALSSPHFIDFEQKQH